MASKKKQKKPKNEATYHSIFHQIHSHIHYFIFSFNFIFLFIILFSLYIVHIWNIFWLYQTTTSPHSCHKWIDSISRVLNNLCTAKCIIIYRPHNSYYYSCHNSDSYSVDSYSADSSHIVIILHLFIK